MEYEPLSTIAEQTALRSHDIAPNPNNESGQSRWKKVRACLALNLALISFSATHNSDEAFAQGSGGASEELAEAYDDLQGHPVSEYGAESGPYDFPTTSASENRSQFEASSAEIDCIADENEEETLRIVYATTDGDFKPSRLDQINEVMDSTQDLTLEYTGGRRAFRIACGIAQLVVPSAESGDIYLALMQSGQYQAGYRYIIFSENKNENDNGGLAVRPTPEDAKDENKSGAAFIYYWTPEVVLHEGLHTLGAVADDSGAEYPCGSRDRDGVMRRDEKGEVERDGAHSSLQSDILFCGGDQQEPRDQRYRCLMRMLDCEGNTYFQLDHKKPFYNDIKNVATSGYFHVMEPTPTDQEATDAQQFSDVNPNHPHYDYIQQAAADGIINGYTDGSFGPADYVLREQAVTMLHKHQNEYDPSSPLSMAERWNLEQSYTDFGGDRYSYPAGQWGTIPRPIFKGYEIQGGENGRHFHPRRPLTRAQAATVITAYAEQTGLLDCSITTTDAGWEQFSDVNGTNAHANAIDCAVDKGLAEGYANKQFGSQDEVTRAQFAAILERLKLLENL
ncbi:hypothetical protein BH23PAT2_BH23PAT2_10420 [soil metagenome]